MFTGKKSYYNNIIVQLTKIAVKTTQQINGIILNLI